MCHRKTYWEKTASSEFEADAADESNERDGAAQRGWWGVRAEDRSRGLLETEEATDEATDGEREEDAIPADD